MRAHHWIQQLALRPHPEGGHFRETYRAQGGVALPSRFGGPRAFGTAIYYLLEAHDFSSLHRIKSDELWHFYAGDPLRIEILTPQGLRKRITLGADFERGQRFQATVGAGNWFGARPMGEDDAEHGFSLVGCTVAPGFDFDDFELARRDALLRLYPEHADFITAMTRTP